MFGEKIQRVWRQHEVYGDVQHLSSTINYPSLITSRDTYYFHLPFTPISLAYVVIKILIKTEHYMFNNFATMLDVLLKFGWSKLMPHLSTIPTLATTYKSNSNSVSNYLHQLKSTRATQTQRDPRV